MVALELQVGISGHGWSWTIDRSDTFPWHAAVDAKSEQITLRGLQPGAHVVTVAGTPHSVTITAGIESQLDVRQFSSATPLLSLAGGA